MRFIRQQLYLVWKRSQEVACELIDKQLNAGIIIPAKSKGRQSHCTIPLGEWNS